MIEHLPLWLQWCVRILGPLLVWAAFVLLVAALWDWLESRPGRRAGR